MNQTFSSLCWLSWSERWKKLIAGGNHLLVDDAAAQCHRAESECDAIARAVFILDLYQTWNVFKHYQQQQRQRTQQTRIPTLLVMNDGKPRNENGVHHKNHKNECLQLRHKIENICDVLKKDKYGSNVIHLILKIMSDAIHIFNGSKQRQMHFRVNCLRLERRITHLFNISTDVGTEVLQTMCEVLLMSGFSEQAQTQTELEQKATQTRILCCHRSDVPKILQCQTIINDVFIDICRFADLILLLKNYSIAQMAHDFEHSYFQHRGRGGRGHIEQRDHRLQVLLYFESQVKHPCCTDSDDDCVVFRRNHRNRDEVDNNHHADGQQNMRALFYIHDIDNNNSNSNSNSNSNDSDSISIAVQSMIDEYHAYFLHSRQLLQYSHTLFRDIHRRNEKNPLTKLSFCSAENASDYNEFKGIVEKRMQLKNPTASAAANHHHSHSKFVTNVMHSATDGDDVDSQNNNNDSNEYALYITGDTFNYWPGVANHWSTTASAAHNRQPPIIYAFHSDLKEELFENPYYRIANKAWLTLCINAHLKKSDSMQSRLCKWDDHHFFAVEDTGDICAYDSCITVPHILVLLTYCNFDELQFTFKQKWRRATKYLTPKSAVIKRVEYIAHWCRLLMECAFFGEGIPHNEYLYHGISKKVVWSASGFVTAVSCSTEYSVSECFARPEFGGMVVTMKRQTCAGLMRSNYFNCEWISAHKCECERLLCFADVHTVDLHWNFRSYAPLCSALRLLECLLNNVYILDGDIDSDGGGGADSQLVSMHTQQQLCRYLCHRYLEDSYHPSQCTFEELCFGTCLQSCFRSIGMVSTYHPELGMECLEAPESMRHTDHCLLPSELRLLDDTFVNDVLIGLLLRRVCQLNAGTAQHEFVFQFPTQVVLRSSQSAAASNMHIHIHRNENSNNGFSVVDVDGDAFECFHRFSIESVMGEFVFRFSWTEQPLNRNECGIVLHVCTMPQMVQQAKVCITGKLVNTGYGFIGSSLLIFGEPLNTFKGVVRRIPILFCKTSDAKELVDTALKIAIAITSVKMNGSWCSYSKIKV